MKTRSRLACLLLFTLLLAGCQVSPEEQTSSASSGSGERSSSIQSGPVPSPKTPQELLEEQPIDDTHDAFLVDTGGRMGTLLVTAELGEQGEFETAMELLVWDPADMSRPLQSQDWMTLDFGEHQVIDVDFDGHSDLIYLFARGVQAEIYHCMRWDEEQGLFVEEPEYANISSPWGHPENQTISGWNRESAAGDGVSTIHQWIDGELVCVRRIELFAKDYRDHESPFVLTVQDRIDGELTEVFREEYPLDPGEYFDVRMKWEDLDYHGETE